MYETLSDITPTERIDAESQTLVYAQQVAAGAKLAASFMVRRGLAECVSEAAAREGCATIIESAAGWETVTIYKYPFVRKLLQEMDAKRPPHEPPSMLDVWSAGKLFGYSDYEIARFLEDHGYIESALT